jgi:hypothetical protein
VFFTHTSISKISKMSSPLLVAEGARSGGARDTVLGGANPIQAVLGGANPIQDVLRCKSGMSIADLFLSNGSSSARCSYC